VRVGGVVAGAILAAAIIGRLCWGQTSQIGAAQRGMAGRVEAQESESGQIAVWDVYGEFVIRGPKVHQASVAAMLRTGIKAVTGESDPNAAWRRLLRPDDVVALKFTEVGGGLGTGKDLATALLHSLYQAGFQPGQIMIVGLEDLPEEAAGTLPCPYGWQQELADFGTDRDYLALWLEQVTAIVNVASVLDDNVIGLRGALANLTLPLVKRPARLYVNGGDPFVADVYALPEVRGKVRLHILSALRILGYGGPRVQERYVVEYGALLFSEDPVALDQVALHLVRLARRLAPLPESAGDEVQAPYLETAQALGLGCNDLNRVAYHRCKHERW